jgi:tetratricopeptide (TPR) repeat protein
MPEPVRSKGTVHSKRAVNLDVLERRWLRGAERLDWRSALEVANQIVERNPDEATGWIWQSVSLHKLRRTTEARARLLVAAERFPSMAIIYYHLACYACQLGQFTESSQWWTRALKIGNKELLTMMAANEEDLRPLWRSLGLVE